MRFNLQNKFTLRLLFIRKAGVSNQLNSLGHYKILRYTGLELILLHSDYGKVIAKQYPLVNLEPNPQPNKPLGVARLLSPPFHLSCAHSASG